MDNTRPLKSKSVTFLEQVKIATCSVFVNLLKDRKVSQLTAMILTLSAFLQIYGTLCTQSNNISWDDDLISGFVYEVGILSQLIPYCARQRTVTLYWLIYACCKKSSLPFSLSGSHRNSRYFHISDILRSHQKEIFKFPFETSPD